MQQAAPAHPHQAPHRPQQRSLPPRRAPDATFACMALAAPCRAGSDYATSFLGFYEGAIQTAEAVANTLSGLLKKA